MEDVLKKAMAEALANPKPVAKPVRSPISEPKIKPTTVSPVEVKPEKVSSVKLSSVVTEPGLTITPMKSSTAKTAKGLDQKAVLVSINRRMFSPYKLDKEESKKYGAGNVNKHLFEGAENRVKKAIKHYSQVYTFVKENTVPWSTGVDMLNIHNYMDFTKKIRLKIAEADNAVKDLVDNWDDEVALDLARLQQIATVKNKPSIANPSDYPSQKELEDKFSIDVRFMPVPTTGDFRVSISDSDKDSLQRQINDAEKNAATHVLENMIDPMRRAIEKLNIPIGDKGAIFRDSLIDNMVEVADRMNWNYSIKASNYHNAQCTHSGNGGQWKNGS